MHRRNMLKLCGAALVGFWMPWKAEPAEWVKVDLGNGIRPLVVGPGETLRLESDAHYLWIELRGGKIESRGAFVHRLDIYSGEIGWMRFTASSIKPFQHPDGYVAAKMKPWESVHDA